MKVLVCLKQVPDTEANIKVADDGKSISESGIKFIINPYDEFALEEALKLKDEGRAQTVSVISLGPSRTMEALRSALAMGADEALLLRCNSWLLDGLATARILAAEIAASGADLVLTGKEAIDDGHMQVGPMLGQLLGMPSVSVVTGLEIEGTIATAEREVEGGIEVVKLPLPCVVTCQKGLNEPRYPSIRGVMMAKKKTIPEKEVDPPESKIVISSLGIPPARSGGVVIGEGPEAVDKLVELLRHEAKVI